MKLHIPAIMLILILASCADDRPRLTASTSGEPGTLGSDRVPEPTQGFDISFQYDLPPCYNRQIDAHFPVIYLITMPSESQFSRNENTPMSLADRLIHTEMLPPVIIIIPGDIAAQGYHAALALDRVSYVDESFNTIRDGRYRGVGGISHGAAIAARMAFQFPEKFGSVGIFSGGIDSSEKPNFEMWIASAKNRPRVLVDIGDQDGIMPLTQNLLQVLDAQNVSYEMHIGTGGHNWAFWSAHMESYLLWFAEAWEQVRFSE
jgi:enterochelin esterase-like enzyme